MKTALAIALAVAPVAGCEAIDDFSPYHVVAGDGAASIPDMPNVEQSDMVVPDDLWWPAVPNCTGIPATCGSKGTGDCCESTLVPGGTFNRLNDKGYPAVVSTFRLDRYEITVGRFRSFVLAHNGTQASPPTAGSGANTVMGTGWDPMWDGQLASDTAALQTALKCDATHPVWTNEFESNENVAMNCLTWYEAFAFCTWDGGRLPTATEWNYAAAGGSEQRVYPWGSDMIDPSDATYGGGPVAPVGAKSPKGDGKWGQSDLAGNVWEWTFDYAGSAPLPCVDCVDTAQDGIGRIVWGGSVLEPPQGLQTSSRVGIPPGRRQGNIGARCARTVPCALTLDGVGAGDFTISFIVSTTPGLNMAQVLLAQRSACDNTRNFWEISVAANGNITVETGGQAGYAVLTSNSPVNDGKAHAVTARRRGGALLIAIDGRGDAGPLHPGSVSVLNALAPLEIEKISACNFVAQGVTVTNVCLTAP